MPCLVSLVASYISFLGILCLALSCRVSYLAFFVLCCVVVLGSLVLSRHATCLSVMSIIVLRRAVIQIGFCLFGSDKTYMQTQGAQTDRNKEGILTLAEYRSVVDVDKICPDVCTTGRQTDERN